MDSSMKESACARCGSPAKSRCKSCLSAYYCHRTCQRQDWPTHKKICRAARKGRGGSDTSKSKKCCKKPAQLPSEAEMKMFLKRDVGLIPRLIRCMGILPARNLLLSLGLFTDYVCPDKGCNGEGPPIVYDWSANEEVVSDNLSDEDKHSCNEEKTEIHKECVWTDARETVPKEDESEDTEDDDVDYVYFDDDSYDDSYDEDDDWLSFVSYCSDLEYGLTREEALESCLEDDSIIGSFMKKVGYMPTRDLLLEFGIFQDYAGKYSFPSSKKFSSKIAKENDCPIERLLPDCLLASVFSFCSIYDVVRMKRVSRRWKTVASSTDVWRQMHLRSEQKGFGMFLTVAPALKHLLLNIPMTKRMPRQKDFLNASLESLSFVASSAQVQNIEMLELPDCKDAGSDLFVDLANAIENNRRVSVIELELWRALLTINAKSLRRLKFFAGGNHTRTLSQIVELVGKLNLSSLHIEAYHRDEGKLGFQRGPNSSLHTLIGPVRSYLPSTRGDNSLFTVLCHAFADTLQHVSLPFKVKPKELEAALACPGLRVLTVRDGKTLAMLGAQAERLLIERPDLSVNLNIVNKRFQLEERDIKDAQRLLFYRTHSISISMPSKDILLLLSRTCTQASSLFLHEDRSVRKISPGALVEALKNMPQLLVLSASTRIANSLVVAGHWKFFPSETMVPNLRYLIVYSCAKGLDKILNDWRRQKPQLQTRLIPRNIECLLSEEAL